MVLSLWPGSTKQAIKNSHVAGWSKLCSSNLHALDLLIRERERMRMGRGRKGR
jgi:hypothetical protein